jgi:hypothetical protein
MLRTAARALRAATSRNISPLGRVCHFAELSDASSAVPELQRFQLKLALVDKHNAQALALEDKKAALADKHNAQALALEKEKAAQALALEKEKAAQALALEKEKAAQALALEKEKAALVLALEDKKAAQSRGVWEVVFGMKRESAQMVNLVAGGVFFVASGAYIVSGMLHDVWAHMFVMENKAESASQDVRAFMTNAQSACCLFASARLPWLRLADVTSHARLLCAGVSSSVRAITGRCCTTCCTNRGQPLIVYCASLWRDTPRSARLRGLAALCELWRAAWTLSSSPAGCAELS